MLPLILESPLTVLLERSIFALSNDTMLLMRAHDVVSFAIPERLPKQNKSLAQTSSLGLGSFGGAFRFPVIILRRFLPEVRSVFP